MNEFKEIEEINFKIVGNIEQETAEESLQRTEAWLEARSGNYTGSNFKLLMKCGRSTSKQPWGSLEKLVDFGTPAEKYLYAVGMERNTGERSQESSSKQMRHGKEMEPLFIQQLIDDGVITDFEELGFEIFPEWETGGASVDGTCKLGKKFGELEGKKVALELKCCVSWDGHYARMYEKVHDKHDDFWQFQAEMLSVGLDSCLYVVALPMTIKKYDTQIIKASKVHQGEMVKRCQIGDSAIKLWEIEPNKAKALELACATYKEEQEDKIVTNK
jgi:YqaJ-like viral recombinase domain